jgi:hypothetical protein
MTTSDHPLNTALAEWLPEYDFAVLAHGFLPHGRDYKFILQVAGSGTYELILTHVVNQRCETNVRADVWPSSWDDILTDYSRWEANGFKPEGYAWGTNWSNAYPGLQLPTDDPIARHWSELLAKPMFAVELTTDRFRLHMVFHGARWKRVSDDDTTIARTIIPLRDYQPRR